MIKVTNQQPTLSEANRAAEMEPAVQLPRHIFFDLSGAGLRCFGPAPAVGHVGVPFGSALEALHQTRLSRADLARPDQMATVKSCEYICDPDTVSDAGTSGAHVAAGEPDDEVDSFDELFFEGSFARKIDALVELVGMKGTCEPAAVLGEVIRAFQEMDRIIGRQAVLHVQRAPSDINQTVGI